MQQKAWQKRQFFYSLYTKYKSSGVIWEGGAAGFIFLQKN